MSDQITEEYQEQVLVDLSEIKDSVTTDSGYQDKVLDDLHDIKESVSEEQEYYDKEYQKKVLGNLRSLQKSVEALDDGYSLIVLTSSNENVGKIFSLRDNNSFSISNSGLKSSFYCYDVSDFENVFLTISNPGTDCYYFLCNTEQSSFVGGGIYSCRNPVNVTSSIDKKDISVDTSNNFKYFTVTCRTPLDISLYSYTAPVDDNTDVTSGSAVMVDGIDTLIQISTFQGFASALLTGILLFLLFVKGLRR